MKNIRDLEAARKPHAIDHEGLEAANLDTIELDRAGSGFATPGNQIKSGRLARAVGADQRMTLTLRNAQVHPTDDLRLAKVLGEFAQFKDGRHASPPAISA